MNSLLSEIKRRSAMCPLRCQSEVPSLQFIPQQEVIFTDGLVFFREKKIALSELSARRSTPYYVQWKQIIF